MSNRFGIWMCTLAACTVWISGGVAAQAQSNDINITTRDPITGAIADGTVKAIATPPSLVFWLGDGTAFITGISSPSQLDPNDKIQAKLVGYKSSVMNGDPLKRGRAVLENTTLENGAFKNPGPYIVFVDYVDTATGDIKRIELLPGFGLLVGSPSTLRPTHEWGCTCRCEDSDDVYWTVTLACNEEDEGGSSSGGGPILITDCNCDDYNDQVCLSDEPQEEPGVSKNCTQALIPLHWDEGG